MCWVFLSQLRFIDPKYTKVGVLTEKGENLNLDKKNSQKTDIVQYMMYIKVNWFRNDVLVSSIFPKNERKNSTLRLWHLKLNGFRLC